MFPCGKRPPQFLLWIKMRTAVELARGATHSTSVEETLVSYSNLRTFTFKDQESVPRNRTSQQQEYLKIDEPYRAADVAVVDLKLP